jgi:radical SAM superfamily enzyme YgiQ (UPF0313 family)
MRNEIMTSSALLVKLPEPVRKRQKVSYVPPIGLWSIAHNLRKTGAEVQVIDLHMEKQGLLPLLLATTKKRYDTIGLSAQFSIQNFMYETAARYAKATGARVIAGGFHAAAAPPPDGVDEVFRGDGELLYPGKTFEDIEYPEITAEMMRPYWEAKAPHDLQSKTDRWMPVEFSRGCNHHCGFCGVNGYWGGVRYFDREKVRRHLSALAGIGVKELFIEDDNIVSDAERFGWLKNTLRDFGFAWSTPNGIRAVDLARNLDGLAASGCWRVSLPFETGSPNTARLMRLGGKWMERESAARLVGSLQDQGIKTCGFFIIGYPGESLDDVKMTLDYANSLPLDQRNIYIATPYPGTPLFDICREKGYLLAEPPELYDRLLYTGGMITTPEFTAAKIEAIKYADRLAALERKKQGGTHEQPTR